MDFPSAASCPSAKRCSAAQALNRCRGRFGLGVVIGAPQRLAVYGQHTLAALGKPAHEPRKPLLECLRSNRSNTLEKVSWLGIAFLSSRKDSRNSRFEWPKRAMPVHVSPPQRMAKGR